MTEASPTAEASGAPAVADDQAHHHRLSVQLVRFVVTGCISAVVDYGLLSVLMSVFGWDHTWAKAVSFVAGTTTAYMINRRWTFRAAPSKRRFLAIVALYGISFALQVGIFSVVYNLLLPTGWPPVPVVNGIAFVIAQGIATAVNFVVQRAVIFRRRG